MGLPKPTSIDVMIKLDERKEHISLYQRYKTLSVGKRAIIIVFIAWFLQAAPKWSVIILADGELSSKIMRVFITPRGVL